jgi:hypothetical protein
MTRSSQDVRTEIASEREELRAAVATIRAHANRAKRRLPLVAAGVIAGVVVLRAVIDRIVGTRD